MQTTITEMEVMTIDAKEFISMLIKEGRKVGIISCEDPYNTPFHNDVTSLSNFVHLVPRIGAKVDLASLDLGLQAKGINTWGIFGHYGKVHDNEVCAAISALNNGYQRYGPDLRKQIESIAQQFEYDPKKSLNENIIEWIRTQCQYLLRIVPEKQRTLKGAVQGDIIIFGGLVENSPDGKSYKAQILFSNKNAPRH